MSKNRKKVKAKAIKTASVMGALVLAASPVIPYVGQVFQPIQVSAAYSNEAVTTDWSFQYKDVEGAFASKYEGVKGEVSDVTGNAESLVVDATNGKLAAGNNGKGYAQINKGTVIYIPVSGKGTVTVTAYPGQAKWTIAGIAATTDVASAEYNVQEGTGVVQVDGNNYVKLEATGNGYIYSIQKSEYSYVEDPEPELKTYEDSKVDVWDFGAEVLDSDKYNNNLTVDVINSAYAGVAAGTANKTIGGFTAGDLTFATEKTNNRLRTSNTALTRYDANGVAVIGGVSLTGCLYFNGSAGTRQGTVSMNLEAGDAVTMYAKMDNADDVIQVSKDGAVLTEMPVSTKGSVVTYVAASDGTYTFNDSDATGKLRLYRVERERQSVTQVTGKITVPDGMPSNYKLVFTSKATGTSYKAVVSADGTYTVKVPTNSKISDYQLSLLNAEEYVISSETALTLGTGNAVISDVMVEKVPMTKVTGSVTGLSADELSKLNISFDADGEVYKPVVSIDTAAGTYSVNLAKGVTYNVTAEGVNDYSINVTSYTAPADDADVDIAFVKKPVYNVNLTYEGLTESQAANAVVTFTNLNEDGYSYTFTGTDNIALRDGTYSVKVVGAKAQRVTSNLVVSGGNVSKTVAFKDATDWTFTSADFKTAINAGYYNGLALSTGISQNNSKYLLGKSGATVQIPVDGACQVKVSYCYTADATLGVGDDTVEVKTESKSTGNIETATYNYTGTTPGSVTLTFGGDNYSSYITQIQVIKSIEYKPVLTVGAENCDYTSVAEAVKAAESMDRVDEKGDVKRVTIQIQPGNYEEMVVINGKNITLKNASENASTDLINKGVDIADNAVRITWYYGHGYSYYSMGDDCKYDEDTLKANTENGYYSYKNPGSGTTNGSYWNATVVVYGSGFEADGIIFENSFNQYQSEAAARDTIVKNSDAKEGSVTRNDIEAGSTKVQEKAYVERAAALAMTSSATDVVFDNCRFVGRQDTLYGAVGTTVAFNKCQIMGATDFIFGGMTSVFYKCDLVMNTSENKNDVAYITAAQTAEGSKGYLMYECNVVSTTPGVDTASSLTSKPGYFGRPWAGTANVVFYNTNVATTTTNDDGTEGTEVRSLINPLGWNDSLSGKSSLCSEYGTTEQAGVDNSQKRATWAAILTKEQAADETMEAFLGASRVAQLQANGILTEKDNTDDSKKDEDNKKDEDSKADDNKKDNSDKGNSGEESGSEDKNEESSKADNSSTGEIAGNEETVTSAADKGTDAGNQAAEVADKKAEVAADETKTGDTSRTGLYAVLAGISAFLAAGAAAFLGKKKSLKDEE